MISHGRTVIYTDAEVINSGNVVSVVNKAFNIHRNNSADIQYLYDYYRGNQPILRREKDIRPEINNKIVVNRANEIVTFKTAYLIGNPIQYIQVGDEDNTEGINLLNKYARAEEKAAKDKELVDWMHICGVGYRMVLPDKETDDLDEAPFSIYTLDPRNTFVIRYSGLGNKVKAAVTYVTKENGETIKSVYTKDRYYEIDPYDKVTEQINPLGMIPIIEYRANAAMLGAFEIVLPLLDAINTTASDRINGIEQFIQAIMVFKGVDVDDDIAAQIKSLGGVKVPPDGDVKYLVQELNQTQTQTLTDDMYQTTLTICGMPSMSNGNSSDSSNNGAVIMRNGWWAAESRANDTENMFKPSENESLRVVIKITNTLRNTDLKLSAIDTHFTRRNYENIYQKAQVLALMLGLDEVHPKLAFEYCGMFVDPDAAYTLSKDYADEMAKKNTEELAQFMTQQTEESKQNTEAEVSEEVA